MATGPAAKQRPPWAAVLLFVITTPCNAQPLPALSGDPLWTQGFAARSDSLTFADRSAIQLRFLFAPSSHHQERVVTTTKAVLHQLFEWYGPYPTTHLTIADARWNHDFDEGRRPDGAPIVLVTSRWLSPESDVALERQLIDALTRECWRFVSGHRTNLAFEEGLARYTAARVVHRLLVSRHWPSYRFFGGFVPYTVRAVPLSRPARDPRPQLRAFPELQHARVAGSAARWMPAQDDGDRVAAMLQTLERYIGWPAMQQALMEFRHRHGAAAATPRELFDVVREQRGHDVNWLLTADGQPRSPIDYSIDRLTSATTQASYGTILRVRRVGDALFPLPIVVRFADGSEIRESWAGGEDVHVFQYTSRAAAVSASVDPATTLVVDANRLNNTRTLQRHFSWAGAHRAISWLIWLQDATLNYTSLL